MPATNASLALMVLLGAAAVGWNDSRAADTAQYVAMGSSYAAGPGILPLVPGSPPRCARSGSNYAHVLARHRNLSVVDVSCSGATTVDVLHAGQFDLPAQLDAVTPTTQLVTVTIGGNDVFFMANLIAMSCKADAAGAARAPGACTGIAQPLVEQRFASLADSLTQIVAGARRRSPKVRVVFVNYFTVLPDQGTCARVGLTSAQADQVRGVAARLADITREVARKSAADLFDLATLSRAHNACAADPWLAGAHPDGGLPIPPFHPYEKGMRAVGDALDAYLTQHPQ